MVERASISNDFEVGSEGVGIGEHSSEGFTHVDGASSAHGNNRAAAFFPSNLDEILEVIGCGFALIFEWNKVMCGKGR